MLIRFPNEVHTKATHNIQYLQAELSPSEEILAPKYPWEIPRTNMYGSVFKSSKGYEMYYQCGNALRIGYAFSNDGLAWHRPMMNVTDFSTDAPEIVLNKAYQKGDSIDEGMELTNLVAGYHMPSVIYEPEQALAYKIFSFGEGGYCTLESKEGKQFIANKNNPVIELITNKNEHTGKTWCSDVAPCFKDKAGYTAMVKTYVVDDDQRTRRCVGRSISKDFSQWSSVETIWQAGDAEDAIAQARGYQWADFYGLCPFVYGEAYLGFLWLFEIEKELPRGTNLGKIEVFLAYSPDGKKWQRISDTPLIPWDLNFGEEGGMVTTPSAPIFDDDGIKLYYSDCNFEHGYAEKDFTKKISEPTWVIRCAQLQKERLVGAYSKNGTLELKTICFKGTPVRINVDCTKGSIKLELKVYGETVSGKTASGGIIATEIIECTDDINHSLNLPYEGMAELTVTLNNATLYAIEV